MAFVIYMTFLIFVNIIFGIIAYKNNQTLALGVHIAAGLFCLAGLLIYH